LIEVLQLRNSRTISLVQQLSGGKRGIAGLTTILEAEKNGTDLLIESFFCEFLQGRPHSSTSASFESRVQRRGPAEKGHGIGRSQLLSRRKQKWRKAAHYPGKGKNHLSCYAAPAAGEMGVVRCYNQRRQAEGEQTCILWPNKISRM